MAYSLANFISDVNTRGVLPSHSFEVSWSAVGSVTPITIRCESASAPGVSLISAEGPPRLGVGPQEQQPYGVIFDDVTLTFLEDSKSEIIDYFDTWINNIVKFNTKGRAESAYYVGYRDNYMCNVTITMFDSKKEPVKKIILYRAYPHNVTAVPLSWEATNEIVKLTVQFKYKYYNILKPGDARFNT